LNSPEIVPVNQVIGHQSTPVIPAINPTVSSSSGSPQFCLERSSRLLRETSVDVFEGMTHLEREDFMEDINHQQSENQTIITFSDESAIN
jgi:hypothetical protein